MIMNVVVSLILAFALVCPAAPPVSAEPRQLSQGTEIHLTLLTPINTSTAQEGDAITAVTSEPVVLGGLLLAVGRPRVDSGTSTARKDVKITEGEIIQEKHDYRL
jgi:hypothetical protein